MRATCRIDVSNLPIGVDALWIWLLSAREAPGAGGTCDPRDLSRVEPRDLPDWHCPAGAVARSASGRDRVEAKVGAALLIPRQRQDADEITEAPANPHPPALGRWRLTRHGWLHRRW